MTVSVKAPTSTTGSIQLNGSDVLTIDSSGNLTAPNNITVNGNLITDTDTLYVDATNNRVGIGTSSPSEKFHVSDTSTSTVKSRTQASTGYVDIGMGGNSGVFDTTASDGIRLRLSGTDAASVSSTRQFSVSANNTYAFSINSGSYSWWMGTNGNQFNVYEGGGTLKGYLTFAGSWTNTSDISFKENIEDIPYGIDAVKQLKPRQYNIKDYAPKQIGFIAQEIETVIPEVVSGEEGSKGIAYGNITPVLTAALQEAITKIEDLETRIKALENA